MPIEKTECYDSNPAFACKMCQADRGSASCERRALPAGAGLSPHGFTLFWLLRDPEGQGRNRYPGPGQYRAEESRGGPAVRHAQLERWLEARSGGTSAAVPEIWHFYYNRCRPHAGLGPGLPTRRRACQHLWWLGIDYRRTPGRGAIDSWWAPA